MRTQATQHTHKLPSAQPFYRLEGSLHPDIETLPAYSVYKDKQDVFMNKHSNCAEADFFERLNPLLPAVLPSSDLSNVEKEMSFMHHKNSDALLDLLAVENY